MNFLLKLPKETNKQQQKAAKVCPTPNKPKNNLDVSPRQSEARSTRLKLLYPGERNKTDNMSSWLKI